MLLSSPSVRLADCPLAESRQLSVLGVLEQCPVPLIAVADDGVVLFASRVFEHLLGCSYGALTAISYDDICSVLPTDETLFAVTRLGPNAINSATKSGRATVLVKMRKSAIRGGPDWDAVAMFEELVANLSERDDASLTTQASRGLPGDRRDGRRLSSSHSYRFARTR